MFMLMKTLVIGYIETTAAVRKMLAIGGRVIGCSSAMLSAWQVQASVNNLALACVSCASYATGPRRPLASVQKFTAPTLER